MLCLSTSLPGEKRASRFMHQSALYQILTGDRDVILPGGWIYELGKTVGLEIQHEE